MGDMGELIKQARQLRGMSQEELGKAIGKTKSAISKYELGHREPSFPQLRQIANALNVTVGYLEGYESIESKKVIDAVETGDYRTLEKLIGIPEGSIIPISPEEEDEIRKQVEQERHDTEINLNKIRFNIKIAYDKFTEQEYILLRSLVKPFSTLNPTGKQEAIKRVEELTEIPRYRRQEPPETAATAPAAPQESRDTTPPPEGAEGPQEGE